MKAKVILLLVLILGITQGVNAQENTEENSNLIGFFGVIASGNADYEFGGGFEVGILPKKVGFGFQVEYFPAPELHLESATFIRGLLMFKIAGPFFIKFPLGVESRSLDFREEFRNEVSPTFGLGAQFVFNRVYFGCQFNASNYQVEGLDFSTGSAVVGIKF